MHFLWELFRHSIYARAVFALLLSLSQYATAQSQVLDASINEGDNVDGYFSHPLLDSIGSHEQMGSNHIIAQSLFNSVDEMPERDAVSKNSVQQLSGRSIFTWITKIREIPDYSQTWDSLDDRQRHGLLADDVQVFYLDRPTQTLEFRKYKEMDKIRYALDLRKHTVFEFPNGVNYLGIYYERDAVYDQPLSLVFTLSDGTKKEFYSCTKTEELMKFTGFATGENVSVVSMEVLKPIGTNYSVNELFWGSNYQTEYSSCDFKPAVTAVECDDENRWLVDVEVSKVQADDESWWCANDEDRNCGDYGDIISFGYFSRSEKPTVNISFQDQKNGTCSVDLKLDQQKMCSDKCLAYYNSVEERDMSSFSAESLQVMIDCQGRLDKNWQFALRNL